MPTARPGTTCWRASSTLKRRSKSAITFDDPKTGKHYELNEDVAVILARPRWHLFEKHARRRGTGPGGLFDFGLYFFHNAQTLLNNGSGPYFYLPKLESHLEARLWADVFESAQDELGIPRAPSRLRSDRDDTRHVRDA